MGEKWGFKAAQNTWLVGVPSRQMSVMMVHWQTNYTRWWQTCTNHIGIVWIPGGQWTDCHNWYRLWEKEGGARSQPEHGVSLIRMCCLHYGNQANQASNTRTTPRLTDKETGVRNGPLANKALLSWYSIPIGMPLMILSNTVMAILFLCHSDLRGQSLFCKFRLEMAPKWALVSPSFHCFDSLGSKTMLRLG